MIARWHEVAEVGCAVCMRACVRSAARGQLLYSQGVGKESRALGFSLGFSLGFLKLPLPVDRSGM